MSRESLHSARSSQGTALGDRAAQQAGAPHAAVVLDVTALEATAADDLSSGHAAPIPWKTGEVGVVAALDQSTTVTLVAPAPTRTQGTSSASRSPTVDPTACTTTPPKPAGGCGSSGCGTGGCGSTAKKHASAVAERAPGPAGSPAPGSPSGSAGGGGGGGARKATGPSLVDKLRAKLNPKRAGSGLPARPIIRGLVWARRVSQAGFFSLFMYFLFQTGFRGNFAAQADQAVRLPLPVEAFLLADPFVGAMTVLSTHTVYRGLLWSLGLLGLTLLVGRVFCGWICPFGTLHHFFAWILPSPKGRGASRVEANKTHGYQRAKYYLMYAFLLASVAGSAIGGMMDPICVAVRSIGLGVIPAAQYLTSRGLGAAQNVPSRPLQGAADHTQDFLAQAVWQNKQFYFHQTWLIVFLLVAILFMNRFVPRFWCRVLCPLGAFLGVFARFALFGMEKDHAKCTDCNLCLVNCQGADSPQGGVKWRQDECHMCMNCEASCPEDVIKFRFLPNRKSAIVKPDTDRRTLLATVAAGAAAIPAMRIADSLDVNYHSKVIRPPGAVEERAFLERCIR